MEHIIFWIVNFIGKELRIGTNPFLGPEVNRKRIANGTHNLQVKGMMTALNIETGEVHRITKELYHSRKDIYFHPTSKVFKEWKSKKETNKNVI